MDVRSEALAKLEISSIFLLVASRLLPIACLAGMVSFMEDALKNFVSDFFSVLGVSTDGISVSGSPRVVVAVLVKEPNEIVGPHGEHLRALNVLARRLFERKSKISGGFSFVIDVNGYLESQLEGVRANARMLAQRARLFKHDVELGPMSSYERLVIHELFAEDPEIGTHSEGEGKHRHVVLKYKPHGQLTTNN